jgi:hypothetical protein
MVTEGWNVCNNIGVKLRSGLAWPRRGSGEEGSGYSMDNLLDSWTTISYWVRTLLHAVSVTHLFRSLEAAMNFFSESMLYYYRRTVGQSFLVSGTQLGLATDFLLLSLIIFTQLWVCWCGASSLTRCRICILQLLLGLASTVFLGSESRRTHNHVLLSQFWDSPAWRARFPYLFPPGIGWPSYTQRHLFTFSQFSPALPHWCWDSTSNWVTIASSHVLPNSLLSSGPPIHPISAVRSMLLLAFFCIRDEWGKI